MKEALLIVAGYVLGSLPWAYWLPLLVERVDIRTVGSGNVGATNVWRSFGPRLGLPVLLLDMAKGAAAALLGLEVAGELTGVLAGAAAVAGHWRPLFLGFQRGGKLVATTGGVGLALAPLATLSAVGVWIAVFLLTRYASVASIAGECHSPLRAPLWSLLARAGVHDRRCGRDRRSPSRQHRAIGARTRAAGELQRAPRTARSDAVVKPVAQLDVLA